MKAARIHRFGGPDVIVLDDVPKPSPNEGEVVVKVAAAGVGPWDALIREGKSTVNLSLPITLGSDLAGVVESVGPGVTQFKPGDEVYGVTNKDFQGAYAEFAVATAGMIAAKPSALSLVDAASVPVVTVTASQMLFDYAQLKAGQEVLIHGAAGNVGSYALQLAKLAGLRVYATAATNDLQYVRGLGADVVIDYKLSRFEDVVPRVDAVLDTVGGEIQRRSFSVLKPEGILVSAASPLDEKTVKPSHARFAFFLVDVSTARLETLSKLFESGKLSTSVRTILPLSSAIESHQMLAGAPHRRGKIVLQMGT